MKLLALTAVIFPLAMIQALAQTPIDPLVRPAEDQARFSYSLAIAYNPGGGEGAGINEDALAYTYRLVAHSLTLTGSIRYQVTPATSLAATLSPSLLVSQEERSFAGGYIQPIWRTRFQAAASVQVERRLAPESPLDPSLGVSLSYPWSMAVSAGASLLRDPVVLTASITAAKPLDTPGGLLGIGLAAGLVANQEITLATSLNMTLPIGTLQPPLTAISLRVAHTLEPGGKLEIALRVDLSVAGEKARAGLALELSGR